MKCVLGKIDGLLVYLRAYGYSTELKKGAGFDSESRGRVLNVYCSCTGKTLRFQR